MLAAGLPFDLRNAAPGLAPEGYAYEPVCVRLDETSELLPQQAGR